MILIGYSPAHEEGAKAPITRGSGTNISSGKEFICPSRNIVLYSSNAKAPSRSEEYGTVLRTPRLARENGQVFLFSLALSWEGFWGSCNVVPELQFKHTHTPNYVRLKDFTSTRRWRKKLCLTFRSVCHELLDGAAT